MIFPLDQSALPAKAESATAINVPRLAALMTAAAREAGALALKGFGNSPKQWPKGKSSVVCEADIAVDSFLRERFVREYPDFGWLSEEAEDNAARLAAECVWIVDPIDGTRSYLASRPDWVISVALAQHGVPVVAVIFAPVTDELFFASAGRGATRNGTPITATEGAALSDVKVAGPKRFLDWLARADPSVVRMPRIGSLALRLTRVAQGELDVAFAGPDSHDWDLAAADLLVHEAGGAMTTFRGRRLPYNRAEPVHAALVAAGCARHAALLALARSGESGLTD
jgi:myo-inositol-1(or 4)-monophosphatase